MRLHALVALCGIAVGMGCRQVDDASAVDSNTMKNGNTVLSVGMSMADAYSVCRNIGLVPIDENSAMDFDSEFPDRDVRVAENQEGDALIVIALSSRVGGPEKIVDIYWHKNWQAEALVPKVRRKNELNHLKTIDLSKHALISPKAVDHSNRDVSDPFGD